MQRFLGFSNEQVLVEAIKNGHESAIEYWFKNYHKQLLNLAMQKLPNRSIAEEIVQETFINCLRSITLFKGDSSLLTYMQSILRHEINDFYRKRYAKKFIKTIYSHYPDAQLVLLNSPMVGGQNNLLLQECITSVQNEINSEVKPGKPIKIFWFNAMQPAGCGYHPSISDHQIMANQLIPFIKQLLKQ